MTTLPPHLQPRLDRELDEGEVVSWVAQPIASILRKQAMSSWLWMLIIVLFFDILFGWIVWVACQTPAHQREESVGALLAMPAIITALWVVAYPAILIWAKRAAENTIYAITDTRALIIVVHRDKSITERDYRGDELIHLARKEYPDGSGTLTFESARGAGASSQTATRHKFHGIQDVIQVERMLRKQFGES